MDGEPPTLYHGADREEPHVGRRKGTKGVERYHDRVARTYDAMYEGSRYWDLYREITWNHLKRFLPRTPGGRALDAGCGTGLWGLRLARCGLDVTFLDISSGMVEQARHKAREQGVESRCTFLQGDLQELAGVEDASCVLATAQGDPLSCCERPERAVNALFRVLAPGGVALVSVDGLYGGAFFFLERNDADGLAEYLRTGRTRWQTEDAGERFPTRAFSADGLRRLFERGGFEVASIIGKPVLPLRRYRRLLEDDKGYRTLLHLEFELGSSPELLGGAAHLEIAARKPA